MFKKLANQLNIKKHSDSNYMATSPFEALKNSAQKNLLKNLSEHALNLYQRKTDIKNFTKLALSNPQDLTHNDLIKEKELDEYDILFDLTNNEDFLKDLDL